MNRKLYNRLTFGARWGKGSDSVPLDEWCKSKGFSDEDTVALKRNMSGRKVTVDLREVLHARKNSPQVEEAIRKIQQAIANTYGLPVDMMFPRER